jgi:hypothetical protein
MDFVDGIFVLQMLIVIPVAVGLFYLICSGIRTNRLRNRGLDVIRVRPCSGRSWLEHFPQAPADKIRHFLRLFAEAFEIPNKHALKIRPDDKIMSIYRTLNPPGVSCDNLEMESLWMSLEKEYQVKLKDDFFNMNLAELFRTVSPVKPQSK